MRPTMAATEQKKTKKSHQNCQTSNKTTCEINNGEVATLVVRVCTTGIPRAHRSLVVGGKNRKKIFPSSHVKRTLTIISQALRCSVVGPYTCTQAWMSIRVGVLEHNGSRGLVVHVYPLQYLLENYYTEYTLAAAGVHGVVCQPASAGMES